MWVIGVLTCSQTYPLIPFPLTFLIPLESGKDTDGCYQDWGAGGVSCDGAGGGAVSHANEANLNIENQHVSLTCWL